MWPGGESHSRRLCVMWNTPSAPSLKEDAMRSLGKGRAVGAGCKSVGCGVRRRGRRVGARRTFQAPS